MAFISRRSLWFVALVLLCSSVPWSSGQTQQDSAGKRRLLEQSAPAYPALARSMGLSGTVRIEAVVSPDGSVKTVEVKGGHPVLVQAAVNAVLKWKWEPAAHESHQMAEVKFDRPE